MQIVQVSFRDSGLRLQTDIHGHVSRFEVGIADRPGRISRFGGGIGVSTVWVPRNSTRRGTALERENLSVGARSGAGSPIREDSVPDGAAVWFKSTKRASRPIDAQEKLRLCAGLYYE